MLLCHQLSAINLVSAVLEPIEMKKIETMFKTALINMFLLT